MELSRQGVIRTPVTEKPDGNRKLHHALGRHQDLLVGLDVGLPREIKPLRAEGRFERTRSSIQDANVSEDHQGQNNRAMGKG